MIDATEIKKKIDALKQAWGTPQDFYDMLDREVGGFDIDVAADNDNTKVHNAWFLESDYCAFDNTWFRRARYGGIPKLKAWCNPPYSKPLPWVERAIEQVNEHPGSVVYMLLNHDHSTRWYTQAVEHASEIRLLTGARIQYVHKAKDWGFHDYLMYLGIKDGSQSDLPHDIERLVLNGWGDETCGIVKARKSTNSKCQCVIVFRKKQPSAPCHVWHWDWQKDMGWNHE